MSAPRAKFLGSADFLVIVMFCLILVRVDGAWQAREGVLHLAETGEGSALRQLTYLTIFAGCIGVYLHRFGPMTLHRLLPFPLILLCLWAGLSLMWSDVPQIALRRYVLTLVILMSLFSLCAFMPVDRVLRNLRHAILCLAGLSLATVVLLPELGVTQVSDIEAHNAGDWRGVFFHKNNAGAVFGVGLILAVHNLWTCGKPWRLWAWVWVLLLGGLLLMTGSKTSQAVSLACGIILLMLLWASRYRNGIGVIGTLAIFAGGVILGAALLYFGHSQAAPILSPDSFTGRGLIWAELMRMSEASRLLGFGYGSVFQVGLESPLIQYFYNSDYLLRLPHAHNAYLELLITLGAVGLILAIWALILAPFATWAGLSHDARGTTHLCLSLMMFGWAHGILESGLFDRDRTAWIILLIAYGVLWTMGKTRQIS